MSTPSEKYKNDEKFHMIVDVMVDMLESGICDYHAIQQASIFASIRHGMIHGMPPCPVALNFLKEKSIYNSIKEDINE